MFSFICCLLEIVLLLSIVFDLFSNDPKSLFMFAVLVLEMAESFCAIL